MSSRLPSPGLLALVFALALTVGPVQALDEFLIHHVDEAGDDISGSTDREDHPPAVDGLPVDPERKQVSLAAKRPARGSKARLALRIVKSDTSDQRRAPASAGRAPARLAPDGTLLCWRRHHNGQLAAVITHRDGLLTAKLWPQTEQFVTAIPDVAQAQQHADRLAHGGGDCAQCRSWEFS
jgi:hypothetical protein